MANTPEQIAQAVGALKYATHGGSVQRYTPAPKIYRTGGGGQGGVFGTAPGANFAQQLANDWSANGARYNEETAAAAKAAQDALDWDKMLRPVTGVLNALTAAGSGIQNVIDGTFETANRTARLTEDAFTGLGDALTDVFTKGKAGWSGLEQTILSGITRIIVEQQLIRPIAQFLQGGSAGGGILGQLFGSVLGSAFGGRPLAGATGFGDYNLSAALAGQRANGGPVERGGLYEINETRQGPGEVLNVGGRQYLMALQGGYVQPVGSASAAGSGASLQQVNHFHISGPIDRRTQQQIAVQAGRAAQQAMARG